MLWVHHRDSREPTMNMRLDLMDFIVSPEI
jgi:hypothetical protein